MPPLPLRKKSNADQLRHVRRELDRLHARLADKGVTGWVLVLAWRGWLADWEHELSK